MADQEGPPVCACGRRQGCGLVEEHTPGGEGRQRKAGFGEVLWNGVNR